jgi:hypothetical protein
LGPRQALCDPGLGRCWSGLEPELLYRLALFLIDMIIWSFGHLVKNSHLVITSHWSMPWTHLFPAVS